MNNEDLSYQKLTLIQHPIRKLTRPLGLINSQFFHVLKNFEFYMIEKFIGLRTYDLTK